MVPEWYYAEQGQHKGPVTFDELRGLAAQGRLRPSDLVWQVGWPNWVPARSQAGLFDAFAAPAAALPRAQADPPWSVASADPFGYQRPVYGPPPRPRASAGRVFATLGIGAAVLLLATIIGVVVAMVTNASDKPQPAAKPSPERTWKLATGTHQCWTLPFNEGDDVVMRVTSDHDSDVDLFVFTDEQKMNKLLTSGNIERNVGYCIAYDNGLSKDCYVRFVAPRTGTYYVVVANRNSFDEPHRNRPNSGKLTFHPVR
jgi:hypothetical protein